MKKILLGSLLAMTLILGGCASGTTNSTTATTAPTTVSSTTSSAGTASNTTSNSGDMTLDQLKKYNGQNGNPAYVAVSGTIYDVSNARNWKNGIHKNGITAGTDLTNLIASSPHGDSVLKGLPIIGKMK